MFNGQKAKHIYHVKVNKRIKGADFIKKSFYCHDIILAVPPHCIKEWPLYVSTPDIKLNISKVIHTH